MVVCTSNISSIIFATVYYTLLFFNFLKIISDYPDYSQYAAQNYEQTNVKYEDEDEQKYEPDNANGNSRHYDDYEEGEAY